MAEHISDLALKLILVGDSGVGKTNLLSQYACNEFHSSSTPTIGAEFATQTQRIDGKTVEAQIWDTAGQERYRAITTAYYRGAAGAILVYDITTRVTFQSVPRWVDDLRANVDDIVIIIVGNKTDLVDRWAVLTEEGVALSQQKKVLFMETSAKDCTNIYAMFTQITTDTARYVAEKGDRQNNDSGPAAVSSRPVMIEPPEDVPIASGCCLARSTKRQGTGDAFQVIILPKDML
jgi:Ras-related protein Rab-11A